MSAGPMLTCTSQGSTYNQHVALSVFTCCQCVCSVEQRVELLQHGLGERVQSVKGSALHLLQTWLDEACDKDVIKLLDLIDVQRHQGTCLTSLVHNLLQTWLDERVTRGFSVCYTSLVFSIIKLHALTHLRIICCNNAFMQLVAASAIKVFSIRACFGLLTAAAKHDCL